ncbi:hypothetical protein GCM10023232_08680 [Sphingosinicella ginsenosidimutans]|uniref:ATP-binding protein n=1 Tax=Allosphingosinicella ginsenosidimutans TaxID=1176539 RepID=A0A5C6TWF6_9SPHN|nr:ATP-binding protein [Sphingosinicella ginsenosidimutans]TXC64677.1 ATP-binding protein [Sphingosinicella ginsenosidimutans]
MALQRFKIENQKSIRLAECAHVPRIMVIAGPNGVGKSTLLYAINQGRGERISDPDTRFLYQGPHRVMRSTQVQRRWLGGPARWLRDILSSGDVSGFEGLNFFNPARTPSNVDEAGSTIKHILGKIENRRQAILAGTLDRLRESNGAIDAGSIPDVYTSLRTLTEFILPHLKFARIDFTNEDDIRCVWERRDAASSHEVDIDDLSSGEKAVIVLFLPLLEEQLEAGLRSLEAFKGTAAPEPEASADRVILIDEPEQHLHPDLQAKILTYMRRVSDESRTQFIITTHSPTILDQAFDTELFVLAEPDPGNPTASQLKLIANNAERLEALKQLAGSAYFLTTGRVIVCIEGERDADPETPTDARLLEILYPRASAVTLVPTTGKGNVILTVQRLREHLPENTFRIRVRGLIDADQSDEIEGVEQLPVCMIENLLLSPISLHTYLAEQGVETFANPEAVERELRRIASTLREKEIILRLRRKIKPVMIRLSGATVNALKASRDEKRAVVEAMLPADPELGDLVDEVTGVVDRIIASGTELDQFRGKDILRLFYQQHAAPAGIAYNPMCIDVARRVARDENITTRLDPVFERLLAA